MSAHDESGNAITITGRRCRYCGHGEVTPAGIEAYGTAAGPDACAAMREALVRRGIAITAGNDARVRCPSCESEEIVDYGWILDDDGRVVPATTTPLKETG